MKTHPIPPIRFAFGSAALAVLLAVASQAMAADPALPFPPLSPEMPYDVDMAQKAALEKKQQFAHVQRLFDIFSWQSFIALNWPVDPKGQPHKSITDDGPHFWETYIESFQVYKADGSGPVNPNPPYDYGTTNGFPNNYAPGPRERLFAMNFQKNIPAKINALKGQVATPVADETLQAFNGPLVDKNGKWVRYEVMMNQPEYDYVVQNQFYNRDGQLIFSNAGKTVNFPSGMNKAGLNRPPLAEPKRGATELKLAWKELGEGDVKSRFVRVMALVQEGDGWQKREMGLVGMHIAVKTESSPTWIWATFEQVDNVRVNDLLADPGAADHAPKAPSFYDPNQPTKPINVTPTPTSTDAAGAHWDIAKVTYPVQVTRVVPIPLAKELLNAEVQGLLRKADSALQYYELIDTQWPTGTDPKTGTAPLTPAVTPGTPIAYDGPNAVANKVPGDLTPVFLTNTTMETYFQVGNQPATGQEEGSSFDKTPVFATESCTGCHYSAGIVIRSFKDSSNTNQAIFGGAGNGDFSWLMAQKAQWLQKPKSDK